MLATKRRPTLFEKLMAFGLATALLAWSCWIFFDATATVPANSKFADLFSLRSRKSLLVAALFEVPAWLSTVVWLLPAAIQERVFFTIRPVGRRELYLCLGFQALIAGLVYWYMRGALAP